MKAIITCLIATVLISAGRSVHAQAAYEIPAGVEMATAEECRAHNDDFIKASDYLLSAPVDAPDRKVVNGFVMKWMINTEDVRGYLKISS